MQPDAALCLRSDFRFLRRNSLQNPLPLCPADLLGCRADRALELHMRLRRLSGDRDVRAVSRGPQRDGKPMPRLPPDMKIVLPARLISYLPPRHGPCKIARWGTPG